MRLFKGYVLSLLMLPGLALAETIGEVSTVFKWVGPNDKIVVEAFDDPKVSGVTCYLSRAKTGGVKGGLGLAELPRLVLVTAFGREDVMRAAQVQGIADVVLVFDDHAEILDYKTDKSRNATYYIESYAAQLRLYRRAFALRLPVPVTKLTIYSFAMQDEIDIPLE